MHGRNIEMDSKLYGELILQSDFEETIREIREKRVEIPQICSEIQNDYRGLGFPPNGGKLSILDEAIKTYKLDPIEGQKTFATKRLAAYDESIDKYSCLEGELYVTAHSIVQISEERYLPTGLVTANFYTKAKKLTENSEHIKYTDNASVQSQIDYAKDKIELLRQSILKGSIVLIDGPIIGGDVYTYMIKLLREFVEENIIPVFFVKNSCSDIVTEEIDSLKNNYNSDMHWASTVLRKGERTSFFEYTDARNSKNSKVFCYVRLFDGSPQRIEFYKDSFHKNTGIIDEVMNCVYYMAILQGKDKNPQIRPIAIAEKYAREYIKICDIKETFIKLSATTPIINEERFRR